jgi:hypothetical protein
MPSAFDVRPAVGKEAGRAVEGLPNGLLVGGRPSPNTRIKRPDLDGSAPPAAQVDASLRQALATCDRACDCERATVTTSRGEKRVVPAQRAALACDARMQRPGKPNRAENLVTLCSRCHGFVHERGGVVAPDGIERVGLNLVT